MASRRGYYRTSPRKKRFFVRGSFHMKLLHTRARPVAGRGLGWATTGPHPSRNSRGPSHHFSMPHPKRRW